MMTRSDGMAYTYREGLTDSNPEVNAIITVIKT